MPKRSAGLLMYRHSDSLCFANDGLEVFLVHPGGPFWAKKDLAAWSIPKGEYGDGEEPKHAAIREFQEETGFVVQKELDALQELGTIQQAGGKLVSAWCFEGDCDPSALISNPCQIEWPPRSGRQIEFPEIDRGAWFSIDAARAHILKSQSPLLDMLSRLLNPDH